MVIAGNGPLNLQLACELLAGGARVVAVVEAAPRPGLGQWRRCRRHRSAPRRIWPGTASATCASFAAPGCRCSGAPASWPARARGASPRCGWRPPAGERRIVADACALNIGFQPETGLARALGAAHRFVDAGLGRLETVAAEDGRTSLRTVFAIGDGAAIGGARIALARGRLAGLAAAARPGLRCPRAAPARAELRRALAFQDALWRLFAAPPFDVGAIADDAIVCRCEEVTAGALRRERARGVRSLASLKKATRAGMGRCQGRMCGATVARLFGVAEEAGFAAPRAPVKPVPVAALMRELEEHGDWPVFPLPAYNRWSARPAAPLDERCDVLVIGGGVLGLSTAYTWRARASTCWSRTAARPAWPPAPPMPAACMCSCWPTTSMGAATGPSLGRLALGPPSSRCGGRSRARPARTSPSAPRAA